MERYTLDRICNLNIMLVFTSRFAVVLVIVFLVAPLPVDLAQVVEVVSFDEPRWCAYDASLISLLGVRREVSTVEEQRGDAGPRRTSVKMKMGLPLGPRTTFLDLAGLRCASAAIVTFLLFFSPLSLLSIRLRAGVLSLGAGPP